eukprot:scaffold159588_cov26-Tisochrysis_lutea.AAC.3
MAIRELLPTGRRTRLVGSGAAEPSPMPAGSSTSIHSSPNEGSIATAAPRRIEDTSTRTSPGRLPFGAPDAALSAA